MLLFINCFYKSFVVDFDIAQENGPVPEPSSVILAGLGAAALGGYALKKRKDNSKK